MKIAVLIACHNRKAVTFNSLSRLMPQLGMGSEVFLVDDGSTDGTGDAIRMSFPAVTVVEGDGSLFWAKGMRKAWEAAIAERQDWDGYLWLNDDTELRAGAIAKMLAANDGEKIIVGELENAEGKIVYGTRPGGLFTGNCVFVPRKVYDRLGMICGEYTHAWADSDYAMMAKRAGIGVVSVGVVGNAEGHSNRPDLAGLSLKERWKSLEDPKGWNLHDLWLYRRRHWGVVAAVISCAHLFLHVLCGGFARKTLIAFAPWFLMWFGYLTFAFWIRGHYDVTVSRFQIHGYDYADYSWFLSDWREILYPRPRHPLWGIMFFPLAVVLGWVKAISPSFCLSMINALFAAVMTSCVWLVTKVLKCGWVAGLLYGSFASSLLLGGMPESFAISALLSLCAFSLYMREDSGDKKWITLGVVAGGVTITQGVKVLLLRYIFWAKEKLNDKIGRLLRMILIGVVVVLSIGLLFILVWLLRKWHNPEYSRSLWDMLRGLTTEFSNNALTWPERINRWWVFFTEPLLTRGKPFEDNCIAGNYSSNVMSILMLPLFVLSLAGMWIGRQRRLVKALFVFLAVDVFVHFICCWGMREPHLYAGHWTFAVPILCVVAIKGFKSKMFCKIANLFLTVSAVAMLTANLHQFGVFGR